MVTKPKGISGRGRHQAQELKQRLGGLVNQRDHGLMTQREFEDELAQIGGDHSRGGTLTESGLPQGGTRIVLRDAATGVVLARFEFRRTYRADV